MKTLVVSVVAILPMFYENLDSQSRGIGERHPLLLNSMRRKCSKPVINIGEHSIIYFFFFCGGVREKFPQ